MVNLKHGATLITILVFGSVFIMLIVALVSTVVIQQRVVENNEVEREALSIAEAGLNYYRWFLEHNPGDFENGTGQPGPYIIAYNDASNNPVGEYEINVTSQTECGITSSINLTSTGRSNRDTGIERTVTASYAKPPVSNYTFIVNDNSWIPEGTSIEGRYHANGGIHMEGSTDSTISSTQSTWTCTESTGCDPAVNNAVGVFGSGSNSQLWNYPVPPLDFAGLTLDLNELKTAALAYDSASEPTYYGPSGNNKKGYSLEFLADGRVEVYKVQSTQSYWSYNDREGWVNRREATANGNQYIGVFELPDDCSVVFFEDDIWISGTVKNKLTIIAADLIDPNKQANIYITDDIDYESGGGFVDGVTILAQGSIYIPLEVPDVLNLKGVFVAQNGSFVRNYYTSSNSPQFGGIKKYKVPGGKSSYITRSALNITGTVVSNGTPNFRWNNGSGNNESGFNMSTFRYDRQQAINPPPLTPSLDGNFKFIDWRDNG